MFDHEVKGFRLREGQANGEAPMQLLAPQRIRRANHLSILILEVMSLGDDEVEFYKAIYHTSPAPEKA